MAIAFNAAADGGNTVGNLTFSYTSGSGSNRLLVVGIVGDSPIAGGGLNADDITSVTYAGVAMTLAIKLAPGTHPFNRWLYLYYLLAPATGSNNVVISISGSHFVGAGAADYTGVKQSSQPDATTSQIGAGAVTSLTTSITTIADNSWAILVENSYDANAAPNAGTGATRRTFDATFGAWGIFDSNAAITPAGSYSMTTSLNNSVDTISHVIASFQPDTGSGRTAMYTPGQKGPMVI